LVNRQRRRSRTLPRAWRDDAPSKNEGDITRPVHKAFASLSSDKASALERDIIDLLNSLNRGGSDSLVVPSEYLEIVVTRK
jgi:hypothetical protein